MLIHKSACVSAIAIYRACRHDTDGSAMHLWAETQGWGAIEFWIEIANLAALSADLAAQVADCSDFNTESFPGVYAYEVDEELGERLWLLVCEGKLKSLDGPLAKYWLGRLAHLFFSQNEQGGVSDRPVANAIIETLTGYGNCLGEPEDA